MDFELEGEVFARVRARPAPPPQAATVALMLTVSSATFQPHLVRQTRFIRTVPIGQQYGAEFVYVQLAQFVTKLVLEERPSAYCDQESGD